MTRGIRQSSPCDIKRSSLISDQHLAQVHTLADYEDYGFDSEEEFSDYYYEGSGVDIREITEEEYKEAKECGW